MDDHIWLSLCYGLLFFSASPSTGAPYAFVELRQVTISNVDVESRILTLVGIPETEEKSGLATPMGVSTLTANATTSVVQNKRIVVVLLLLDGRWQELKLAQLDLRMPTDAELLSWSQSISSSVEGDGLLGSG